MKSKPLFKPEMQIYCVHCGLEQWAPAVWNISHGKETCAWCGKMSKEMTTEEYRKAIKKFRG
jgi:uncharacterized CHY-type Zn-finger protein